MLFLVLYLVLSNTCVANRTPTILTRISIIPAGEREMDWTVLLVVEKAQVGVGLLGLGGNVEGSPVKSRKR